MGWSEAAAVLLMTWAATVGVRGVPNRVRRQGIDTSNIPDDQFLCLLQGTCSAPPTSPSPGCTCVKWWQCRDNSVSRGDNQGVVAVIDLRISCAGDASDICCDDVDFNAVAPTPPPPAPISFECGRRNELGVTANFKFFEDGQAQFGEFPWMAGVLEYPRANLNAPVYVCGGSLIHPRVVLTVAHHALRYTANEILVRLGEWDFKNPTEPVPHQDIGVSQILLHPQYVPGDEFNDLALLILERDAVLGRTVGTVCLPNPGQTFEGSRCYSSGWGKDMFGRKGKFQQILKSIDLPVVNHGQCERSLKTSPRLRPDFFLHLSFLCAGGEVNKDVCTGDGGSPLVCPTPGNPTRYVQAGVVAWGLGCGQEGMPGVYASVGAGIDWIRQALNQNMGFDLRLGN